MLGVQNHVSPLFFIKQLKYKNRILEIVFVNLIFNYVNRLLQFLVLCFLCLLFGFPGAVCSLMAYISFPLPSVLLCIHPSLLPVIILNIIIIYL